jgi:DNA-binding transcriptional ArsR family regulator
MMLRLIPSKMTEHVSPQDTLDYGTFIKKHQSHPGASELKQFERFHASRHLISKEMDTYLDAKIGSEDSGDLIKADVCGLKDKTLTAVFCQTGERGPPAEYMTTINESQNATAIVILPRELDQHSDDQQLRAAIGNGKATMEVLGWFDDSLEATFRETLSLIELLGNETRMRMLAPLLEKSGAKKDYRAKINPKLVYHNISALSGAGLLDENNEGTYDLSQFGKTVLAEFITFLEKTRKALGDSRNQGGE